MRKIYENYCIGNRQYGINIGHALIRTKHTIFLRGSSDSSIACRNLCQTLHLPEAEVTDLFDSDMIFLVVPSKKLLEVSKQLKDYSGIIISVVGFDNYLIDEQGSSCSASETVARLVPTAKVVHGYTWMSSVTVAKPHHITRPSVVHCSDHQGVVIIKGHYKNFVS